MAAKKATTTTVEYEGQSIVCRERSLYDTLLHDHRSHSLELAYIEKHGIAQSWLDNQIDASGVNTNGGWLSAMISNFVLASIQIDRDATDCQMLLAVLCNFDAPIDEWLVLFGAWSEQPNALRDAAIEAYHKATTPPEA